MQIEIDGKEGDFGNSCQRNTCKKTFRVVIIEFGIYGCWKFSRYLEIGVECEIEIFLLLIYINGDCPTHCAVTFNLHHISICCLQVQGLGLYLNGLSSFRDRGFAEAKSRGRSNMFHLTLYQIALFIVHIQASYGCLGIYHEIIEYLIQRGICESYSVGSCSLLHAFHFAA